MIVKHYYLNGMVWLSNSNEESRTQSLQASKMLHIYA